MHPLSKPQASNARAASRALPRALVHTLRIALLLCAAGLAACSTMQATDTGFLQNRSAMTPSADGSSASFRSDMPIDPHQLHTLSVEWATPTDGGLSELEKTQLLATLQAAIAREAEALPSVVGGQAVRIRARITRAESVSPALNVVAAVLLTVPLDRGGAAVEIEVLDAQTQEPLASLAHAYYAPLSEFKARFSRLAPAELALNKAAVELARLLRGKAS